MKKMKDRILRLAQDYWMPNNKMVGESETSSSINANDKTQTVQDIAIKSPELWSPDSPYLYKAEVTVFVNGHAEDMTTTSFGIGM